ncbi:protein FAR1-RELATED SEQUENCE 6-like isoform X2 [Lolium rigidum]|uniref:protein FAR1-RELATED SEQUENCE 6-like isoform X2 n=1 Tax=Lolium rigidum TaxID=89674 RepID=UPI001F5D1490|nr:protein FAR1-RELATED SEQUENCE 6-like isoform X2 [Lolium rigidum]
MKAGTPEGFTDLLLRMSQQNHEPNWDWFPTNASRDAESSAHTSPTMLRSNSSGCGSDPVPCRSGNDEDCSKNSVFDLDESPRSEEADLSAPELQQQSQIRDDLPIQTACYSPASNRTLKRRFRRGEIPDSREPSSGKKSALEIAMRKSNERSSEAVTAPVIGMEFDSLPEAYDFYNLYSWEIGFGIRYGPSRKNPSKSKILQDITCGCQVIQTKSNHHSL